MDWHKKIKENMDWRKKILEIGEAKYEYCGDCIGCGKRLFVCRSHPVRADDSMGGRVATFYADGTMKCEECAND